MADDRSAAGGWHWRQLDDEVEALLRTMRLHRDRDQLEVAVLRDVARAARRLRVAMHVHTELPTRRHAEWFVASVGQLDRALIRLEAVDEGQFDRLDPAVLAESGG